MKSLIFQYADYNETDTLWKKSSTSIKTYADFFTYEYKLLDKGAPNNYKNGIFVPFIEGWYKEYDIITYVECDILATDVSNNIVGMCDDTDINAGHANSGLLVVEKIKTEHPYWHLGPVDDGVVVIPSSKYEEFMKYVNHCQTNNAFPINGNVMQDFCQFQNKNVANLHMKFNYRMDRFEQKKKWWQTFLHYKDNHGQMEIDFHHPKIFK